MSGRKWTDEEKDYLCEHRGIFSITAIAEKLNRTPSAVVNESTALGIGGFTANCEYMYTKHYRIVRAKIQNDTSRKTACVTAHHSSGQFKSDEFIK